MVNKITVRRFDDLHVHFRRDERLGLVARQTVRYAGRAIIMPNTRPPIRTAADVLKYYGQIMEVLEVTAPDHTFRPLMTIQIRDDTTPYMIQKAHQAGAVAGKIYPLGVTTNSDNGLRDFFSPAIQDTFKAMADCGMLILIHGEVGADRLLVTDREQYFLTEVFQRLVERLPQAKIVLEHITTAAAVKMIHRMDDNVAATITAHHLWHTLNDVIGDGVHPHHACMPTPKRFQDRDALVAVAISGNPKFFLGSDSAPHTVGNKECAHGACGVYSAPVLPEVLAQLFDREQALNALVAFTSQFGAEFYGLPLNDGTITLKRQSWLVPPIINGIVPFWAGQELAWKMQ